MIDTKIEWTAKTAAVRIGVTLEEYLARRKAGEKWCTTCKAWKPVGLFAVDRSRGDGLRASCTPSRAVPPLTVEERRTRANASYRRYYAGNGGPRIRAQKSARKRGCDPVDPRDRTLAFETFFGLCAYCGRPATTVDHAIPISRGGGSRRGNLLPACASCNSRKRARTVDEFLGSAPCADDSRIADELILEWVI